ncbi:TRAP transporter small permease [Alginatibacterium sediminis]|uniref:TRAP transporter small permease protein n=1 Tax=Alginatibacterium sediminis TaxID=2164068 RepID=A0A420E7H5_9ALTE|nr:TRAP transporter small permease [Alginatibacterium sediminis]RKF14365.1 TRAP transporter small permease [Alginatibacterium sediminis]
MESLFVRAVSQVARAANALAMAANTLGTLMVLVLVMVVDYDVIARGAFNKPFMGAVEVVQFSMVLIVFLQLPDVVRVNRLTRSDGFLALMKPRFPNLTMWLRRFIDAVSATLMVMIAIAIWPEFLEMYETKDYFGVPGVFVAPWWPIKLTIFLSAVLCSILFICKVILASNGISLIRMNEMKDNNSKAETKP